MKALNNFISLSLLFLIALSPFYAGLFFASKDIERINAQANRYEAQTILLRAFANMKMHLAENHFYSDDPDVAFDKGDLFAKIVHVSTRSSALRFNASDYDFEKKPKELPCEKGKCLRYVYALKASCEAGGQILIHKSSVQKLKDEIAQELPLMVDKLNSINLPCKSKKHGFLILAVGKIIEDGPYDVIAVDESLRIDEGFAKKGRAPASYRLIEDSLKPVDIGISSLKDFFN